MPVTARLSQRFYEQFGDEVTNELVDWFNAVDATYRSDLRELNEFNFARFDAKVEQRFAESDARLEKRFAEQDVKMERRFAEQDVKMERRFTEQDVKMEQRFAQVDRRFAELESRFDVKLEKRIGALESRMVRWMFTFWTGSTLATVGLLYTLLRGR